MSALVLGLGDGVVRLGRCCTGRPGRSRSASCAWVPPVAFGAYPIWMLFLAALASSVPDAPAQAELSGSNPCGAWRIWNSWDVVCDWLTAEVSSRAAHCHRPCSTSATPAPDADDCEIDRELSPALRLIRRRAQRERETQRTLHERLVDCRRVGPAGAGLGDAAFLQRGPGHPRDRYLLARRDVRPRGRRLDDRARDVPATTLREIVAGPPVAEQRETFTPPFVICTTFVADVHDQPAPGQSSPAKLRSPRWTTTPAGSIPIERRYERTVSAEAVADSAGDEGDAV